jgi:tight adherence protein B
VSRFAAIVLAAFAGALGVPALLWLAEGVWARVSEWTPSVVSRAASFVEQVMQPLRLAGEEGLVPTDDERLRLQAVAGVVGLLLGLNIGGLKAGLVMAPAAALLASRSLVWRRTRYRRRVDAGAAAAALALSDALAAGQSVRGAVTVVGGGLVGPIGRELERIGAELEMGAETAQALGRLRMRCRSRRIDLIVASLRIQRRSGGSLATLLRRIAATIEEHDRLQDEVRAASAQARFTSLIVLLLPLFGLLVGDLASPGFIARIMSSAAGRWLFGLGIALQLSGALLVRRLGRVEG